MNNSISTSTLVGVVLVVLLAFPVNLDGQIVVVRESVGVQTSSGDQVFGRYLETQLESLGFTVLDTVPNNLEGPTRWHEVDYSVLVLEDGYYDIAALQQLVLKFSQETQDGALVRSEPEWVLQAHNQQDLEENARNVAERVAQAAEEVEAGLEALQDTLDR